MKVICNRGALLEALTVPGNVVAARTPKPVLQCVKLAAENDALTLSATDLEVAIRYTDTQVQIEQAGEVLVQADHFRDIVRESIDDTLAIEVTGDNANIRGQDSHFKIFTQKASDFPPVPGFEGEAHVEMVEGQVPHYEDVIPKDCDKKMTAGTADLLSAIRRASLLTTEESKGVRLAFSKKGLVLTSRSPEAGEATINFPCKYEGTDVEIGFNPQFVSEALRVVDSDDISLEMTAANRPGLLKAGAD